MHVDELVVRGLLAFGEKARGGAFVLGAVAAAGLVVVGTILLARSPMLGPAAGHSSDHAQDHLG